MHLARLSFVCVAVALGGCTVTRYVNPCYGAGLLIPTDATGDEIVAAADKCIADGGERKQGLIVRAAGRLRNEEYDRSLADADAAIALDPTYADAWYYRGYANEEAGNREAAGRDFDKAIDLGLAPGYAYRARGRLKFIENDFLGAYRDFDTILKANPDDQEAYRLRGSAAAVLERFAQAEADLTRAIELDGEDLRAYSARGYVRYLTNRYPEAAADLKMAMRDKTEGLKTAFLYLAMRAANDPEAWAEMQRRAATLDPNSYPGVFPYLFLGQVSIDDMIGIAERTGKHSLPENQSEAFFYAGQQELMHGNIAAARTWFEKTLATGVIRFDEIRASRKELRAMGVPVPSPDPEAGKLSRAD
ncbi:MAG: tetratricopeptide repeat protein [Alphaproteobacteria bacterium]|nr:tetratricopeptide repeat protein [Alphaproteobacteria bacterium]